MTTQTVNVDAFGYTGTFGAKLRDPDTIATLVATADTVAASGTIASRFVCTFGEVAVIAAGEYLLEFIVNGVSSILYVTLTGVDGEVALARSERAAVLDSAARVKLDATQPDYAPLLTSGYTAPANSDIAAIKVKTDNLPTDPADQSLLEAAITAATSPLATPAQVNAQVLDVLSVDTFGELSSPPAATSSLKDKLVWLFMWARNKATATATERKLYADDTTTIVSTETITDDGTTFTKGESL
jgi:hypothetical protein